MRSKTTGLLFVAAALLVSGFCMPNLASAAVNPITVVSHTPSSDAINVAVSSNIIITFSEPVLVEDGDITLSPATDFEISGSGTNTITLTPTSAWDNNTIYRATVTSNVSDVNGIQSVEYLSWSFTTATSYNVALNSGAGGWNLVSLPVVPTNKNIDAVLGNAKNNISAVWTYDPSNPNAVNGWLVYAPGNPAGTNNLDSMTAGYGYWINATTNTAITGSGSLLATGPTAPPSRNLSAGWNLIGYYQIPGESQSTPSAAFKSLDDSYTGLWGFENLSGAFKSSVASLLPGDAFWISLPSSKVYTPSNVPASVTAPADSNPPTTPQLVDPGVSITPNDSFSVRWNNVGNVTEYILQQDTDSSFSNPTNISTSAIYKNFTAAISPITYYFRVRATNAYGQSAWSNIVDISIFSPEQVGNLDISISSDSPSSYIADEAVGATLAKFKFKATGEDVKVTDLTVTCTASVTTRALKNTKVLLNGVQVGTTNASTICDGNTDQFVLSFGNSFTIAAGTTSVVSIVASMNASDTAENWAENDTLYVGFGGVGAAQGKISLTAITPTNIDGATLTVKAYTVAVMKNQSFSDRSENIPTGVVNAQNVKVASFVVTGSLVDDVDISQIVLRDNATYFMGNAFQNLKIKDSNGSQLGSTISNLNTSEGIYTFTPATAIRILAGQQKAFDVYADVKSAVASDYLGTAIDILEVESVSAVGVSTGSTADFAATNDDVSLQKVFLASHGYLTITAATDTAATQQLVLGSTGVELAKFKLAASVQEDIIITKFVIADDMLPAAAGSLKNFKLYSGSTLLASVASLDSTNNASYPYAIFTGFNLTVPKNGNITLTVKADLTSYDDGGTPNSIHRLIVPTDYNSSNAGVDLPVTAVGAMSGTSLDSAEITNQNVAGNYMTLVRAKLSMAFAADSPSGAASAGSEQTVAKFVATNSANVGNYSLTVTSLNFSISSSGNSITSASTLNIYKDSVSTANKLGTMEYCATGSCNSQTYTDSTLGNLTTSLEIAAGSSRTIIVTLETSVGGFSSNDTLSVGMAADDVLWSDGAENYTTVSSLPLTGKTLVY